MKAPTLAAALLIAATNVASGDNNSTLKDFPGEDYGFPGYTSGTDACYPLPPQLLIA